MVHTSKAAALSTHAAHRDPCAAAIYPAVFLIFIAQNPPHLLFFFDDVSALRGTRVWPSRSDTSGGNVRALAPVFPFQNNAILQ